MLLQVSAEAGVNRDEAVAPVTVDWYRCRGGLVTRTHLKPVPLGSGQMVVRVGIQQPAPALTFDRRTRTERRLPGTQLDTYYRGDIPLHQEGGSPPCAAAIVGVSQLQLSIAHPTAWHVSRRGGGGIS